MAGGRAVVALLFERDVFPTLACAQSWATREGYRAQEERATPGHWILLQADPPNFCPRTFRVIRLYPGVCAVQAVRRMPPIS